VTLVETQSGRVIREAALKGATLPYASVIGLDLALLLIGP